WPGQSRHGPTTSCIPIGTEPNEQSTCRASIVKREAFPVRMAELAHEELHALMWNLFTERAHNTAGNQQAEHVEAAQSIDRREAEGVWLHPTLRSACRCGLLQRLVRAGLHYSSLDPFSRLRPGLRG